jgi:hypothetical protein
MRTIRQLGLLSLVDGMRRSLRPADYFARFLTAATNIPVTYMMVADGRGYSMGGGTGSLAVDAGIGITACLLLGLLLYRLGGKTFGAGVVEPLDALLQED